MTAFLAAILLVGAIGSNGFHIDVQSIDAPGVYYVLAPHYPPTAPPLSPTAPLDSKSAHPLALYRGHSALSGRLSRLWPGARLIAFMSSLREHFGKLQLSDRGTAHLHAKNTINAKNAPPACLSLILAPYSRFW